MADASQEIKRQFRQALFFSLSLIISASLLGLLLLVQATREEQAMMQQRFQREEILQNYMEAMLNQETGFRGFVGSPEHEERFLKSYTDGRGQYGQAQLAARKLSAQEGQSGFRTVVLPLEAAAKRWQDTAEHVIAVIRNGGQLAGMMEPNVLLPRTEEFDAFRQAFHDAHALNQQQVARQERERAHAWTLEGLFALTVMGIGIGASVWAGQRTAQTLGVQAAQLMEQAERLREHRQELSDQNVVLQTQQAELQARNRELLLIGRITAIAASELRLDAVQEAFRGVLRELIPFDRCSIFLLDAARESGRVIAIEGVDLPGWEDGSTHPIGETLIGKVLETARPLSVVSLERLDATEAQTAQAQALAKGGFQAVIMAPLIARGAVIGTIDFFSQSAGRYDAHTVGLAEQVAGRIASALENARLFEEERLKSQLLEVSIQETHHRVKNNLQAISALLDMQLMDAGASIPREVLERTITQIKAIAVVHDMLSHGEEDEAVDVKKAIEKLLPLVTLAYRDVQLEMDLAPMALPMRRMTSLALVVNEVALNALKHCGEGMCHIRVCSDRNAERGWARLIVQDSGPGFPADFDPDRNANIGLQLVTTLVRSDLNGMVSFTNCDGARVEIAFPLTGAPASIAEHAIVHNPEPVSAIG